MKRNGVVWFLSVLFGGRFLQQVLLVFVTLFLGACATAPDSHPSEVDVSDKSWEVDFRYDLVCSLETMSVVPMAVDKYAFLGRLGLYKDILDRPEKYEDALSLLSEDRWEVSAAYLNDLYIDCMQKAKLKYAISDAHLKQVPLAEKCIYAYDQHNFALMSWGVGLPKDKSIELYSHYSRSISKYLPDYRGTADVIYELGSVDKATAFMETAFFECKRSTQQIYERISPAKLQQIIRKKAI